MKQQKMLNHLLKKMEWRNNNLPKYVLMAEYINKLLV